MTLPMSAKTRPFLEQLIITILVILFLVILAVIFLEELKKTRLSVLDQPITSEHTRDIFRSAMISDDDKQKVREALVVVGRLTGLEKWDISETGDVINYCNSGSGLPTLTDDYRDIDLQEISYRQLIEPWSEIREFKYKNPDSTIFQLCNMLFKASLAPFATVRVRFENQLLGTGVFYPAIDIDGHAEDIDTLRVYWRMWIEGREGYFATGTFTTTIPGRLMDGESYSLPYAEVKNVWDSHQREIRPFQDRFGINQFRIESCVYGMYPLPDYESIDRLKHWSQSISSQAISIGYDITRSIERMPSCFSPRDGTAEDLAIDLLKQKVVAQKLLAELRQ